MYLSVLLTLTGFFPITQGGCSDHTDCVACASSSMLLTNCRWCEISRSCHALGSSYNKCKKCTDSSISKLCSVTNSAKCDRSIGSEFKSGDFEPSEAYKATLYSAIAYTDDPIRCAKTLFPDGTLEIVEVVGRKCNYLFEYKECFAVVAVSHSMRTIILAYRGTNSKTQLVDEFATVLGLFKVSHVGGGNVQAYFSNANDQLYTCVRSCMNDLVKKYPNYKVIISGHSLGGAIASVASARLSYDNVVDKRNTTLYTFGMPRPGNKAYARKHDELVPKSWRLVHFRDVVAQLPAKTPFSSSPYHHQREIFYGKDMTVTTDFIECFQYEDKECGNSVLASSSSGNYHKTYYEIPVGSHCDNKMKRRHKRSIDNSDLSHLFTNETCRRIKVSDLPTSRSHNVGYAATTIALASLVFEVLQQMLK